MEDVYIGAGSNLGDRRRNLKEAIRELKKQGIQIIKISPLYETKPWGVEAQPPFLNLVLYCRTGLEPLRLLECLKGIEEKLGRRETFHWGPRVIDLDILFYGTRIINEPSLTVPHPYLRERAFVLKPLSDIAGEFIDPLTGKTVKALLEGVSQQGVIRQQEGFCD